LKIALSPYLSRELTDFDQIWYTDTNFHSEHGNLTKKNRNFLNSRWQTDAILKIVFWQYLSAILANLCKFRNGDEESQADIGHLTKVAFFANSRWRRAAILKIVLYPYLSRNYPTSSKFGMPMKISIPRMAILQIKSKFFKFKMADGRHIENRFWLYLGALLADRREIRKDEESHANKVT